MKERTLIMDAIFDEQQRTEEARQRAEAAEKRVRELEAKIAVLSFPDGANLNESKVHTPASSNPELREEVSTMPGMSQVIFNQGFSQGISEGLAQGTEEKHKDDIKQLVDYFMKENPNMTLEQATEMAKGILK
ncbi:MAG: hypothetical protein IJT16_08775 [Lachnospiraceae bacterium]|nr:hypothetical protein [Lachnospiraceae bacterium]